MRCDEARDLFLEYWEQLLSEELRKELRQHLQECRECALLFEQYGQVVTDLGELSSEPPFWVKFRLNNIYQEKKEFRRKRSGGSLKFLMNKWVVAAVASVLILLNLFYFTNIFPPANRGMRTLVAGAEALWIKAEGFVERVKDSGNFIWLTIFGKNLFADNSATTEKLKGANQGGQNG
jgi:predicted anti-sigma-YlaC factor YlaD